ncbi:MATE family efflux transporter [Xylanibacter brevis]|uniref:MATE family efflux transporter n=1 Tax=Xylanibacter brevis TaxID=83231 RepID=UPI0005C46285|nr:MATE family efflux transporter [Xylanibacter brevis]
MDTSLNKKIINLAVPSIVSNITVPLLGLCDVVVMGHVGGARHIGAIAVGSMIFNVMYWLFGFLRMGTSGLTAQAFGARQLQVAATMLRRGLLVALAVGLLIVVLQWPLRHLMFFLMQLTPEVAPLCASYYNICIWGAPAMLGLYVLMGWLIGMQNTRVPMLLAIGQNVVNISMSLFLVIGFDMEIRGVALGTMVAQWSTFLVGIALILRFYGRMLRRHPSPWRELCQGLARFFSLNLDIFLRTVCLVAVNLYFTSAGARQGAEILAANTLLLQFFMFFSYVMDGFAFAGEALAGRYQGARNQAMLQRTIRYIFGWGVVVATLFTLAYYLGGTTVLSLLTTDAAVVLTATGFLWWAVAVPFAGMAAFVWDGIFIGILQTRGMLISCLVAALCFFLIYWLLFPVMQNHALWLAFIAYLLARGAVCTLYQMKSSPFTA